MNRIWLPLVGCSEKRERKTQKSSLGSFVSRAFSDRIRYTIEDIQVIATERNRPDALLLYPSTERHLLKEHHQSCLNEDLS